MTRKNKNVISILLALTTVALITITVGSIMKLTAPIITGVDVLLIVWVVQTLKLKATILSDFFTDQLNK